MNLWGIRRQIKSTCKKSKRSSLNIYWEIYKEGRNDVQSMIKYKEKIFWRKSGRKYGETKRTLTSVSVVRIIKQKNFIIKYLLWNNCLSIDSVSRVERLKKYYSPLMDNLVLKLPKPPDTNKCWNKNAMWRNSFYLKKVNQTKYSKH